MQTLNNTRAGAIIGSELVKRYGWKVGDRFALQSPVVKRDGSRDWTFDVVGVFSAPEKLFGAPPSTVVVTNFDYVNQARANDADRTQNFIATVANANEAGAVSLAIDNAFANSDHETRTRSEGDLVKSQLHMTESKLPTIRTFDIEGQEVKCYERDGHRLWRFECAYFQRTLGQHREGFCPHTAVAIMRCLADGSIKM